MDSRRKTVQWQLVLDAVKELDCHATAEQVYEHVVKTYPAISKATVYRNLNTLSASGELLNIGTLYGCAHFDHRCHMHYHFVCEDCKKVFDVEGDFSEILGKLKSTKGFDVSDYQLTFSGLCWNCKNQAKSSA